MSPRIEDGARRAGPRALRPARGGLRSRPGSTRAVSGPPRPPPSSTSPRTSSPQPRRYIARASAWSIVSLLNLLFHASLADGRASACGCASATTSCRRSQRTRAVRRAVAVLFGVAARVQPAGEGGGRQSFGFTRPGTVHYRNSFPLKVRASPVPSVVRVRELLIKLRSKILFPRQFRRTKFFFRRQVSFFFQSRAQKERKNSTNTSPSHSRLARTERAQKKEGWEDGAARRHHTGILRRGVWC